MKVLKFGGTSLGNPQRMKEVINLCAQEERCCVVLSAVSGTTNALQELSNHFFLRREESAKKAIEILKQNYKQYIKDLFDEEVSGQRADAFIQTIFKEISDLGNRIFTKQEEAILLSKGEIISSNLFYLKSKELGFNFELFSALDVMRTDENGEPNLSFIREKLTAQMNGSESARMITQGYICRDVEGNVNNLNRGGSDYTAALVGEAILADEIQIWTDIDGMHNNDPRVVENTYPIDNLSYNEAAELAYFGAKILHPQCVFPAQRANIPLTLRYTMNPESNGTRISSEIQGEGIKSIAAKDGITAIKIKSSRMLMAHGFLSQVFEVFNRYKTSIDMITTSEVAVSLTIDNDTYLTEILESLKNYGEIEVDVDQCIICVVGDLIADSKGYASQIFGALNNTPVRMVSYGGSRHNISILIDGKNKENALRALNSGIFLNEEV